MEKMGTSAGKVAGCSIDPAKLAAGGYKNDEEKQPWHLLPWDAVDEVVRVLKFGRDKYRDRNWEVGMSWSRCFSAAIRHLWKWWQGEACDEESGLSHLSHAACCVLFLIAYEKRDLGADDRPNTLEE
jgi:hypothetical protein